MSHSNFLLQLLLIGILSLMPSANAMAFEGIELTPVDKNVQVQANIRQAKYLMEQRGDYVAALKLLKKALQLSPNNAEAKKLQGICNSKIEEQLRAEKEAYNNACKVGTKDALQSFINKYPNSTYRKDAENRIADYELWTSALHSNTKTAYQSYLTTSKYLSFKDEANEKIKAIEAEEEWNNIKNSKTASDFESYLEKFPNSPHVTEAKWNRLVLLGEEFYSMSSKDLAFSYLNEANDIKTLTGSPWSHFNSLKQEREYKDILNSNDVGRVRSFLNGLSTSSEYYNPVSNHLALLLARYLGRTSSDYSMDEALSYAKDASTKSAVNSYIHSAKQARSQYNRQMNAYAHKRWWRENFSWGIDADYGTNISSESGSDMYYSAGLVARFGSYKHTFNMTVGVKYRWFRVMPPTDFDDDVEWELYGGAIAIPINLRFNIGWVSTRSRVFLGIVGEYGAKTFEKADGWFENSYVSVFPKFGITSPHFDMSVYWKTYIGGPFIKGARDEYDEYKSNSLIGLQMAVFF